MKNPRFQWNGTWVGKPPERKLNTGEYKERYGVFKEGDFVVVGSVRVHHPAGSPVFYTVEVRSKKAVRGFPERSYIGIRGSFEEAFTMARSLLHMLYRTYMEHCAKQRREHADRVFRAKARAKWESIWPAIREFRKDFYK